MVSKDEIEQFLFFKVACDLQNNPTRWLAKTRHLKSARQNILEEIIIKYTRGVIYEKKSEQGIFYKKHHLLLTKEKTNHIDLLQGVPVSCQSHIYRTIKIIF